MKRLSGMFVCVAILLSAGQSFADVKWMAGGNMGLAITTGSGLSSTDFTFGPAVEVLLNKNVALGTELDITTATGTPISWVTYFKYYFTIPGSGIKPYADAGFGLVFVTGGPFVEIPFGGGASFPVARNLYVSAEIQLGPEFYSVGNQFFGGTFSTTLFIIAIRPGIRYEF